MTTSKHIIILVTTKNKAQAAKIARSLLTDQLIACANIVDGVTSMFHWEGKIDQSAETMLILKTTASLFKKVEAKVKLLHSYKVPEIIALPITNGSADYLKWIKDSVAA